MKTGSRKSASNRGFILISVILSVTLLLTTATAFAWYAKNELKRAPLKLSYINRDVPPRQPVLLQLRK
jgi:type II secretory pathway component PulK